MFKLLFGRVQKKKPNRPNERLVSSRRVRARRVSISYWARLAQQCEIAIASIDKDLSMLKGKFIRARKELLLARRNVWQGQLRIALSYLGNQKCKLDNSLTHNLDVTIKRF
jgi:hypothetical protein